MGYRTYINSIPTEFYEKVKVMTRKELHILVNGDDEEVDEDDYYVGLYDLGKELHGFGKYVEFGDEKFYSPFFTNEETQKYYLEDHDCWKVEKEFLAHVIDHYSEIVRGIYRDMITPFWGENGRKPDEFLNKIESKVDYDSDNFKTNHTIDFTDITQDQQNAIKAMIDHTRSMGSEWGLTFMDKMRPYELDKREEITSSWKYEYAIFELVRIYKEFDWENNVMYYHGY